MSENIGGVAEWLKAHAWKACLPKGNAGSNPAPSAITHPSKFQIDPNKGRNTGLFHGFYSIR